jgi:succinylarginine dihydrolase
MPLVECTLCHGEFPIGQFYKNDAKEGRKRKVCRACHDLEVKRKYDEYREANKEKILKAAKVYRLQYWKDHKDEIMKKRKTDPKVKEYQANYRARATALAANRGGG